MLEKRLIAFGFLLATLWACTPTVEKIDALAEQQGGEAKIADIITNSKSPFAVRVHGTVTLARLGDLNHIGLVYRDLPKDERLKLAEASATPILELLKHPDSEVQGHAKDSLHMLIKFGEDNVKSKVGPALVDWYRKGFTRKYGMGKYSAFNVLTRIGDASVPMLIDNLKTPDMAMKSLKILQKFNDQTTKKKVCDTIITWWNEQYPNPERPLIQTLHYFRDERVYELVLPYLLDNSRSVQTRYLILEALSRDADQDSVPTALKIALDSQYDIELRAWALDIIGQASMPEQALKVFPLLKDERVKWGAFGVLARRGGSDGAARAIAGLNYNVKLGAGDFKEVRMQLKDLTFESAEPLAKMLDAKQAPQTALALIGLAVCSNKELADRYIKPLFDNSRTVAGFDGKGGEITIGELAKQVYQQILKRS